MFWNWDRRFLNWTRSWVYLMASIDGALAQAQSLSRDADTAAVQGLHGDLEALALFAQQVLLGDDAVLKDQVAGGAAADAHLLLMLADGEAGEVLLDDEGRDAVVAQGLVSVMANTTKVEATLPLVMKHLLPLST